MGQRVNSHLPICNGRILIKSLLLTIFWFPSGFHFMKGGPENSPVILNLTNLLAVNYENCPHF